MDERTGTGLPSAVEPVAAARVRRIPLTNVLLLLATLGTTTVAGALWDGLDPFSHPAALVHGLPFAGTLIAILLAHESGHYLMCLRHGVDASLPYFIPAPPMFPLGTFGAFIRIRARFPDRRALFDIGAAGPWAGFVVALAAYVHGLRLSTILPPDTPGDRIGDSLLTALLDRLVLGVDAATVVIEPHPILIAGWFGFFVTALNLLPAGQLDGGHALYAALGRRPRIVPALVVAILVWLGTTSWPGWLVWAVIVTLVLSLGHPPTRDDRRPLGLARQLAALATLVLFVLTFVPEPFRLFK